jgi:predicted nucleic acid-binding protein
MRRLMAQVFDPETTYEFEGLSAQDVSRAMQMDAKFHELQLGVVDGTVAAVAERRRTHRVLAIDRADFGPLRVGEKYDIPFDIVP